MKLGVVVRKHTAYTLSLLRRTITLYALPIVAFLVSGILYRMA
jgi:hypothetical protein